jgi:hypothetical protein
MIVLAATRVDDRGHFKYVVEGVGRSGFMATDDLSAVVDTLEGIGVDNPYRFVSHAEQWGMVELVDLGSRSQPYVPTSP